MGETPLGQNGGRKDARIQVDRVANSPLAIEIARWDTENLKKLKKAGASLHRFRGGFG
jgi:hypothetical protein